MLQVRVVVVLIRIGLGPDILAPKFMYFTGGGRHQSVSLKEKAQGLEVAAAPEEDIQNITMETGERMFRRYPEKEQVQDHQNLRMETGERMFHVGQYCIALFYLHSHWVLKNLEEATQI